MNTTKIKNRLLSIILAAVMLHTLLPGMTLTASAAGDLWTDYADTAFAGGDGSGGDPYRIATAEQLAYLEKQVNTGESYKGKYFAQTANIDLAGHEWVPIGQNNVSGNNGFFEGSYDGGSFEIRNMTINSIANDGVSASTFYSGLFGVVNHTYGGVSDFDKYIKNINLTGVSIDITLSADMQTTVGGLIAEYRGFMSAVTNCSISGSLNFSNGGYNKYIAVGGLVGDINSTYTFPISSFAVFDGCLTDVDITAWGEEIGGFAGSVSCSTYIKNCGATGSVTVDTGNTTIGRDPYVGGFFGYGFGQSNNEVRSTTVIENCYATGGVTCETAEEYAFVGGFGGGFDYGVSIKGCYAAGNVAVAGRDDDTMVFAGGFAGSLTTLSVTETSYAVGDVEIDCSLDGFYAIGGGFAGGLGGTVDSCYAAGSVTALDASGLNRAFGFSGNMLAGSKVTNSAALGETMTAATVSPFLSSGAAITTSGNIWYGGMDFGGETPVNTNAGGTAAAVGDITDGSAFSGWDGSVWGIGTDALPTLKGIPASLQSQNFPDYLYRKVSFETGEGSSVAPQNVVYGKQATEPSDPTRSGYTFDGWYTDDTYTSEYTFVSPVTGNLTLYAKWKTSGTGTNTSTGGGGSTTSTVPAADGAVQVSYSQSGSAVTLTMPDSKISEIIGKSDDIAMIDLSGVKNATTATLPKSALNAFANAGLDVEIMLPQGTVVLDGAAAASVAAQAGGSNVSLEVKQIQASSLTSAQRDAVKDGDTVIDINMLSGTQKISTFDGELTVTIPYSGELPVAVWYLNDAGELEKLECTYNAADKTVSFTLNHLSLYVVGQDTAAPAWVNPFSDVNESDWFYNCVKFAATNGLFSGTTASTFSPGGTMTRGMMVTVLWRMAGSPDERITAAEGGGQFSDVAEDAYYYQAVNWAAANCIVSGIGEGRFAPDSNITREQMAVMLWGYAQFMDTPLPSIRTGDFADEEQISDWAKEAANAMYAAGVLNGKGANHFDPQGGATRAEVATMFMNFLEAAE